MNSAWLHIKLNSWEYAIKYISAGLNVSIKDSSLQDYPIVDLLTVLFNTSLDIQVRRQRVSEFFLLLKTNTKALKALKVVLINHLGSLHRIEIKPFKDNLNSWKEVWECVTKDTEELSVTMRIFSVGIEFLLSDDNDESILLQLVESERSILIQAFGLDEEK